MARMKGNKLFNIAIWEQEGPFVTEFLKTKRDRDPIISLRNPRENNLTEIKLMENSKCKLKKWSLWH